MADFSSLKQTIQTYIKQNGNEEITGNILQDVLLAMVSTMGDSAINSLASALQDETTERQNQDAILQGNITAEATTLGGRIDGLHTAINGINTKLAEGYIYAGIATPSTNPGTLSGKVFYIATAAGTYTNFRDSNSASIVLTNGINILNFNGTSWNGEQIIGFDGSSTPLSANLVQSGVIYREQSTIIGGKDIYTVDGAIYYSDGSNQTGSGNYLRSEYLIVPKVGKIYVNNVSGNTSFSVIYFYDKNKMPISGVTYAGSVTSYEAIVPANAYYFRVCSRRVSLSSDTNIVFGNLCDLYLNKYEKSKGLTLEEDEKVSSNILQIVSEDNFELRTPNGYMGINGVYYETENYRTTKPIPVGVGDFIEINPYNNYPYACVTDVNGNFIRLFATEDKRIDFVGYLIISYRYNDGIRSKLNRSLSLRNIYEGLGYDWRVVVPTTKTPNGYWGQNGVYYNTNSYRTSNPIRVSIGMKVRYKAAGAVSQLTRVYENGDYISTKISGTGTAETYEYDVDFNGYITISWRVAEGLELSLFGFAKEEGDNSGLKGVKWGAMGDSLTDEATLANQSDPRNYVDLIAEATGIIPTNYGKSGSGYKAREAQNEAFYEVASTVADDLDIITIFGSGNDQNWVTLEQIGNARDTGTETLCGCMNTAIDNLIAVNPLVRIGLVTPTPWRNYPPDSTTATWMLRYSEKIVEVAALRGIPCLDLYHYSNLRPWNDDALAALYIDNTHPNTEGHKRIASQIKAFLIEMAG